ncbi:MAG: NAD(+) synthase [Malacoplasma sp.]|nr:NAD(+) synthase [Malacoplasma sp.]
MKFKNIKQYADYLNKWLYDFVKSAHKDGVVLGISGGIDSALCLALCNGKYKVKVKPYFIDFNNTELDVKCVKELAKKYKISIPTLNISSCFNIIVKACKATSTLAKANIKPRLRMTALYTLAQQNNMLVLGTSNAPERYLGYFTKYGDAACDVALIAQLLKKDIYEMSKSLKLPDIIIKRAPSASLYVGQTDEKELGITYKEIDNYLENPNIKLSPKSLKRIKQLHKASLHKVSKLNMPEPYKKLILSND